MRHSTPVVFPRIEIKKATLEPHSRLYSLEPVGVGTPLLESLVSYTCRLAKAHCWTVSTLIAYELEPFLEMPYLFKCPDDTSGAGRFSSARLRAMVEAVNGTSNATARFVTSLEHLTKRQDLRFLSLLSWKHVFTPFLLLRRVRAWCPDCYQEWNASGQTLYDPLLWAVNAVEICSRHQRYLVTHCPYCNKQGSFLRTRSRAGYCPLCEKWLGVSRDSQSADNPVIDESELRFQMWAVENVGELLASAPTLKAIPIHENVVKSMSAIIDNIYEGVPGRLAQDIGKYKSTVWGWKHGKNTPALLEMLIVCRRAGISLLDFLTAEGAIESGDFGLQLSTCKKSLKRKKAAGRKLLDLEAVELALTQYLVSSVQPLPLLVVAERIGYGIKALKAKFPVHCKEISLRFATHRSELSKKKRADLLKEVLSATHQLYSSGQPITRERIAHLLNRPAYWNSPRLIHPMREARRQLGIQQ